MRRSLVRLHLLSRASQHATRTAVVDRCGRAWTYAELLERAAVVAPDLPGDGSGVMILTEPGAQYVAATFASWQGQHPTVPLCAAHTVPEMAYYCEDAQSTLLLHDNANTTRALQLQAASPTLRLLNVETAKGTASNMPLTSDDDAPSVIFYTSGTTAKPKGVVHTFASLQNQIASLCDSWAWTADDSIINCLPLHHVHGVVNVLFCALHAGASCEFSPASPDTLYPLLGEGRHSLFMAVPTVYAKLLAYHVSQPDTVQAEWKKALQKYRLMVSGSASLPEAVLQRWHEASGHILLERYGMTEAGMILSQPLHGDRIQGTVGVPLQYVEAKVLPTSEVSSLPEDADCEVGELVIRSRSLFKEYLGRPEATKESFTEDGWFITGDYVRKSADGVYSVLGRSSVDIIKSSGYKLSAIEIESVLLQCDGVVEVAVLGVPDEVRGEDICALVYCAQGCDAATVEQWCATHLAKYKQPRTILYITAPIPRNAMGKVNKKELLKTVLTNPTSLGLNHDGLVASA